MMFTDEIAAVGPTSFEFCVPEGAPLMVSPAVGTVLPGQVSKCLVIIAALVQYTTSSCPRSRNVSQYMTWD